MKSENPEIFVDFYEHVILFVCISSFGMLFLLEKKLKKIEKN
jgi:hypothetical protein